MVVTQTRTGRPTRLETGRELVTPRACARNAHLGRPGCSPSHLRMTPERRPPDGHTPPRVLSRGQPGWTTGHVQTGAVEPGRPASRRPRHLHTHPPADRERKPACKVAAHSTRCRFPHECLS